MVAFAMAKHERLGSECPYALRTVASQTRAIRCIADFVLTPSNIVAWPGRRRLAFRGGSMLASLRSFRLAAETGLWLPSGSAYTLAQYDESGPSIVKNYYKRAPRSPPPSGAAAEPEVRD